MNLCLNIIKGFTEIFIKTVDGESTDEILRNNKEKIYKLELIKKILDTAEETTKHAKNNSIINN